MTLHLYKVYFSEPSKHGYRCNGTYQIVTNGVVRAAQLLEEKHPEATIFNVVHSGQVEHIDPLIIDQLT